MTLKTPKMARTSRWVGRGKGLVFAAGVAHERVYKKSLPAFFDRFEREDKNKRYDWHRVGPKPWTPPAKKPGPFGRLLQAVKIRSPSSPSTSPRDAGTKSLH